MAAPASVHAGQTITADTAAPSARPSSFRAKLRDLQLAVRETWFYASCGIGGGLLLSAAGEALKHREHPTMALLLEHMGMGLIVAGVAVVMYEWGGHFKPGLKLSAELNSIRTAVSFDALERGLGALLKGESRDGDEELQRELIRFVTRVRDLYSRGDWACFGYAQYLCEMLKDAGKNAEQLSEVSTKLREHPESTVAYAVRVLSPSQLSDIMLAEQMKRLPDRGSYQVVSNPGSWARGRLALLHGASEQAVRRGVTIQRIIVLTHKGPHRWHADGSELRAVLTGHLDALRLWKGATPYEVRVLDETRYDLLQPDRELAEAADQVWTEHFGIFARPGERHLVLVQVKAPDLSDLQISGLGAFNSRVLRFAQVWKALKNDRLSERLINEVVGRWTVV